MKKWLQGIAVSIGDRDCAIKRMYVDDSVQGWCTGRFGCRGDRDDIIRRKRNRIRTCYV